MGTSTPPPLLVAGRWRVARVEEADIATSNLGVVIQKMMITSDSDNKRGNSLPPPLPTLDEIGRVGNDLTNS